MDCQPSIVQYQCLFMFNLMWRGITKNCGWHILHIARAEHDRKKYQCMAGSESSLLVKMRNTEENGNVIWQMAVHIPMD